MAENQTDTADAISPAVTGYGISYAITSILSALLVILKESYEGVQALLVSITGHHWISHGLLAVIVFVALGALLSRRDIAIKGNTLITAVVGSTIVSGLIIIGYFGL